MKVNDLTALLGQGPSRSERRIRMAVAPIIAAALGMFLGLFVLWAVMANDPTGGEPVAVAPTDLRIAKKAPELVPVPQPTGSAAPAQAAAPESLPPPPAPKTVTVTIIDGKTGAKREVLVSTPTLRSSAVDDLLLDQYDTDTTGSAAAVQSTDKPSGRIQKAPRHSDRRTDPPRSAPIARDSPKQNEDHSRIRFLPSRSVPE